ncbi:MAG: AAA family ATPase [Byssovorax sp.]
MLERLRLTDFKSFVDEDVELAPLTLLVGANASGKSNFLDALRFLQQTAFDSSLADILNGEYGRPGGWPGIRGKAPEAARLGTNSFAIESTWTGPIVEDGNFVDAVWPTDESSLVELTHRIACTTLPDVELEAESLGRGRSEGSLFRTGPVRGDQIEVPWPSRRVRPNKIFSSTTLVPRSQSVSWTVLGTVDTSSPTVPTDVVEYIGALSTALYRLQFVDIQPARMRAYGRRRAPLNEDGSNISGVLAQLCDDPEEKRTLVEWLTEICAPDLVDLDFIEVPELGDVMAVLVEKGGRRITARSLSDGTLRFLGMLVALRTAAPGSVILMEDIEADLHPTRIRMLVEYLEAVTRERNIQIIATTHSPVVLEWLSEDALRSAIVFGRIPESEGTVMRRLGDLPHFDEIVKRKGIDELFTTGWLEMAL